MRVRKKPTQSWIERSKYEIENADRLLTERQKQLKEIRKMKTIKIGTKHFFELPDGYQFTDENGNVINTTKIILEKKKPKYPNTPKECCEVLNTEETYLGIGGHKGKLLQNFQKLLICRDAYWKIAGEEMGLEKPWEPDWNNLSTNHEFIKINKGCFTYSSRVLVFPTEEMRDAFYDNFKGLIESCKEVL